MWNGNIHLQVEIDSEHATRVLMQDDVVDDFFYLNITPRGEWADPGGTAIPGQPVGKSEQAPASSPSAKNQFNIDVPRWGTYQILS